MYLVLLHIPVVNI